jgi:AcrR family transcriptional regulator
MLGAVATRRYEQRARAQAAEETRRRILDAMYDRLREAPSQAVSVDRVAKEAGVARSTVYLVFGSRAGLFDAVGRDVMERAGYAGLLQAVRQEDAREHMRGGLSAGARMYAAETEVIRALFGMARLDPDAIGGAVAGIEAERSRGMARLARRLGEQGLLRADVPVEDAAHVLWVVASFESFDALFTGRGLSLEETTRLLVATAERALLRP